MLNQNFIVLLLFSVVVNICRHKPTGKNWLLTFARGKSEVKQELISSMDIQNTTDEIALETFVKVVSVKMQDPIQNIASAAKVLGERLNEDTEGETYQKDISTVVKSLRMLNDYNKAIYKYSLISRKQYLLKDIRLIELFFEVKDYSKSLKNVSLNTILSDVFVMADYDLLFKAMKELISDILYDIPKYEKCTIDVQVETKNQNVYIRLKSNTTRNLTHYTNEEPTEDRSEVRIHYALASRMIHDLEGSLIEKSHPNSDEQEYMIVLKKATPQNIIHLEA
ncbi:MAG: hypothetical protein AAF655_05065 [Bacteroidota bacterium]